MTDPAKLSEQVERIQQELAELIERLPGIFSRDLLNDAYQALDKLPDAVERDEYQEAVSKHQQLVASGAPEADVAASHARLMAQLGRLPDR